MPQQTQPLVKRTKAEILEAYEELRSEFESARKAQLPLAARQAQKQGEDEIVTRTVARAAVSLEDDIVALKRKLGQELDGLQTELVIQNQILADIRAATIIEQKRLTDVRKVSLADDALQLLIGEYDQKRAALEIEIAERRRTWEQEVEEYSYQLKMKRRKEEDVYAVEQERKRRDWDEEMARREQAVREREEAIVQKESDWQTLQTQVSGFAGERDAAIATAVSAREGQLNKEFLHEKQLLTQETEAARHMLEATTKTLERTVEAQTSEIQSLKTAVAEANRQAQQLASTVIENVSGAKHMKDAMDAMAEQTKNQPFPRQR